MPRLDLGETNKPVQTATIDAPAGDFRLLAVQVRAAGLIDRRIGYYAAKIAMTIALFALGWAAFFVVGDSWVTLGVAAFLGVMFTQLGFLGHDAGHLQVFRSRQANRALGFVVGDLLIGMSFGWWVGKHNAHHAHPNESGRDPDIGDGSSVRSSNEEFGERRRGLSWFVARWQAELFFPLMLLRSIGLHVSGIQRLVRNRDRAAATEASLIAIHAALYIAALVFVLSPLKALAFIAVQQGIFSLYLGCSFAPNHKGMPIVDRDEERGFAERQIITARNIAGGYATNFLLGGLNYQIEHHLFPTMPRPNLARAQSIVRAFCVESGYGYCEDSLFGSYRQALIHMRAVTREAMLAPLSSSEA